MSLADTDDGVWRLAGLIAAGVLSLVSTIAAACLGLLLRGYIKRIELLENERSALTIVSTQLAGLARQFEKFENRVEDHHAENRQKLDSARDHSRDWRENVFQPALEELRLQAQSANARLKVLEDRRRK